MTVRPTALLGLFLLATACAMGQDRDTGAVFGTISDPRNAVLPGTQVTILHESRRLTRTVRTNSSGAYFFGLLPVGRYALTAERPTFSSVSKTGIELRANENVQLDIVLEISGLRTAITVEGAPTPVETRQPTLNETIDQTRLTELPLNGRNAADLALLAAGVLPGGMANVRTAAQNTGDLGTNNLFARGQKHLSVDGARNNNLRYTLDGGENMDVLYNINLPFPFPDALHEFSVQTANLTPSHGVNSSGSVNAVTKSGGNDFHGTASWFLRNSALNASNFFSHERDQLKRNQAGFVLGGPIRRNRLFFFFGFQQLYIRTAAGDTRVQTLSPVERRGDFSSAPMAIRDPLTGDPFPNNIIPQSRLSRAAQNLLKLSPLPGTDGYLRFTYSIPESDQQYIGRLDYRVSERHALALRAFQNDQNNPYNSPADNIHAVRTSGVHESLNASIWYDYVPNATMISHTQLTAMHFVSVAQSNFPTSFRDLGVNVYSPSNDISVLIANSGVAFDAAPRVSFKRASEELLHDWFFHKRNHTVNFGTQLSWRQYNEDTIFRTSGYFQFDGHATGSGDALGFDRADFVLGGFSYFTQNNGELENRRQAIRDFYFGDVWRVSPRVTVSAGLRYEPYSFFTDIKDRNQTFSPENYSQGIRSNRYLFAPPGLLFPGDPRPGGGKVGRGVMEPALNNWGPRFGVAWDVFGDHKTSIRSGFGIYYDSPSLQAQNGATDVSPFSYNVQFYDGSMDDPYSGREKANRFPVTQFLPDTPFDMPLYTIVLDNEYKMASAMNWNVTIEREIGRDARFRLSYVGSKGTHLKGEYDENAPIYNSALSLAQNRDSIQQRRLRPEYDQISRWFFGLNSQYNALQLSLDKRFRGGIALLGSYTWSKALDYISQNGWGGDNLVSNPFNFFAARGVSDQNRAHRFSSSWVWSIPSFSSRAMPFALRAVTRGWSLSGLLTLQSGRPFSIAAAGDPLAGGGTARVDLLGSGNPVYGSRAKGERVAAYFDVQRFANPDPGTYGTLGRNPLVGPGYVDLDVALVKHFAGAIGRERVSGQLRFEAFNATNRTNFGLPNTGMTNPSFGQLVKTDGDPRILQIAARLMF